ncbi:hypothetical protein AB1N83_009942 [Pleurotus pulmonarius]
MGDRAGTPSLIFLAQPSISVLYEKQNNKVDNNAIAARIGVHNAIQALPPSASCNLFNFLYSSQRSKWVKIKRGRESTFPQSGHWLWNLCSYPAACLLFPGPTDTMNLAIMIKYGLPGWINGFGQ